ncbi:hypothetical protein TNCV_79721 [Trichonephila clavipes]|nr:hypothetical protein TNCV_79721 [Trichonephila clavipes]
MLGSLWLVYVTDGATQTKALEDGACAHTPDKKVVVVSNATCLTYPQDFGPTDLTSTYSECTRRVFGRQRGSRIERYTDAELADMNLPSGCLLNVTPGRKLTASPSLHASTRDCPTADPSLRTHRNVSEKSKLQITKRSYWIWYRRIQVPVLGLLPVGLGFTGNVRGLLHSLRS